MTQVTKMSSVKSLSLISLFLAAAFNSLGANGVAAAYGSPSDCWDQDRLNQMKMNLNPNQASDPNLAQFFNLVKCLQGQKGGFSNNIDPAQWNNFQNNPGGNNLFNMWNRNNNNQPMRNGGNQGGPQQGWPQPPNNNNNQYRPNQPMPGVHPGDHNNRQGWNYNGNNNFQQPQPGWPGPQRPPPPQQPHLPPSRDPNGDPSDPGRGGRKDRNRKNKPRNKDRRNKHDGPDGTPGSGPGGVTPLMPGSPGSDWNKNRAQNPPPSSPTDQYNNNDLQRATDTDTMMMNSPERTEISLKRQYGYAIMALSVVVLAVLTVITIFCCNSSNSSGGGGAASATGVPGGGRQSPANFSIYSYKQDLPVAGSDTMRSTAIESHLMPGTHTLQSRASPQYRVSDIDPEYARRYHGGGGRDTVDNHHY